MGSYALSAATRIALQQYTQQIATINGAENFATTIEVQPARQQTLIERYQEVTDFLKRINIVTVQQATGDKLGLGNDQRVASNTDTRIQPRRPTPIGNLEHIDDYVCTQTDYDVAYLWAVIDQWGAFPDFQKRLRLLRIYQLERLSTKSSIGRVAFIKLYSFICFVTSSISTFNSDKIH